MPTACLVCNAFHLEMIDILRHPKKLDSMLKCLLGLETKQDDYLCNKCCCDVINTFDAKQEFHMFSLLEPKELGRDGTVVKYEVTQCEQSENIVSSDVAELKIEGLEEEPNQDYFCKKSCCDVINTFDVKQELNQFSLLEPKVLGRDGTVVKYEVNQGEPSENSVSNVSTVEIEDVEDGNDRITDNKNEILLTPGLKSKAKQVEKYRPRAQRSVVAIAGGKRESNFTTLNETVSSSRLSGEHFNNASLDSGCKQFGSEEHCKTYKSNDITDVAVEGKPHEVIHTGEKPYKCCECEKGFSRLYNLKVHERIHTGEKPYKCCECEKSFVSLHYLKVHARIHTGEKPYKCCRCEKGFITPDQLKIHEWIHTGEKPYKCSECEKSFVSSCYLKVHERIHTGEKPYKCSECGKSFISPHYLKVHERMHTGKKPYKCCECKKGFSRVENLKVHKRIHTGEKPYKCCECDKSFVSLHYLKVHERIHTGEKPYKCFECGKRFISPHYLKSHERMHTGEKPYKCRHCEKGFSRLDNLKVHERIH